RVTADDFDAAADEQRNKKEIEKIGQTDPERKPELQRGVHKTKQPMFDFTELCPRKTIAECKLQIATACRRSESIPRTINPAICPPIRLPSRSSAPVPGDRVLFPLTPWQLFQTGARRVLLRRGTHRRSRRRSVQVESRTKRLLRVLVKANTGQRAKLSRLRFLCPSLTPL